MRTFISINIDNTVKEYLLEIQNRLKNKISVINKNFLKSINWTEKDNFHLTLFFLGEINEKKLIEIDNCLSEIQSGNSINEITLNFKRINAFPNLRYPRVLIVEMLNEDNDIFTLSKKVSTTLNLTGFDNDKKFHPHFTLGRVKRNCKINLTGLIPETETGYKFIINKFQLMESKFKSSGVEYSVLKEYKLIDN